MNNKRYAELERFILDNAENYKNKRGNISWHKLSEAFSEAFPGESAHPERLRSMYRKHHDSNYKVHQDLHNDVEALKRENLELEKVILKKIKKKWSVSYLAKQLDTSEENILNTIMRLQFEGYGISTWQEGGNKFVQLELINRKKSEPKSFNLDIVDNTFKFAVFSDTHIGHKQSRREEVQRFIISAYSRGVRDIFFAGDLLEGHYMSIRPTSIKELEAIGFDDQLDLADETLPTLKGLTYHMISGNHDGTFGRHAFANPIKQLAKRRKDIVFHGHNFAKLDLTPTVDISLVHPTDGIGQNYSLKMRQHIDRAHYSKLTRFIFMGHYHKFDHTHYKGIDGFIMPAFVGRSHFMDDKNLESVIGGIVLTLNFNDQLDLVSFVPEYFFYDE
jgi:biotin operon repressor/predicted phosphodiesterase